jgi:hypothetical protein
MAGEPKLRNVTRFLLLYLFSVGKLAVYYLFRRSLWHCTTSRPSFLHSYRTFRFSTPTSITLFNRKMATSSLLPPLPEVPGTDPSRCILDSFRIAIAKQISDALPPLTLEQAYTGVDYGKKGVDFTVALPRFRLPGKVDELAQKVVSQVSVACFISGPFST